MMLGFQVRDMRKTIGKLLNQKKPPVSVMILQGHADYLGVTPLPRNSKPDSDDHQVDLDGKKYGPLCKVETASLFVALQTAKGVDEGIIQAGGSGAEVKVEHRGRSERQGTFWD